MSVKEITRRSINIVMQEFDRIGQEGMLEKYLGGRSRRWYVEGGYDLKLIGRAADEHQGLGPLSPGPSTFRTYDARDHLRTLGIRVIAVAKSVVV